MNTPQIAQPGTPTSPSVGRADHAAHAHRRRWLTVGVAAVAALAGGALAWRGRGGSGMTGSGGTPAAAAGADTPMDPARLWQMQFEGPAGEPLAMAAFRGKPLLINFWATWCPPCVEELPLLNSFYQENKAKSWQVLGMAIDQPSAVRKFMQKTPLNFPVAMGGLEGTEISRSLGNLTGSLPFTVVFDAKGAVVHRKMGSLNAGELQALLKTPAA